MINLLYFCHPDWATHETDCGKIMARGWITKGDVSLDAGGMAKDLDLLIRTADALTLPQVAEHIRDWRGNFAFCVAREGEVILCSDIIRSIPIFYEQGPDGVVVSDSYERILGAARIPDVNVAHAEEFLVSGFVYGNATLHTGIHALQAGEVVRLKQCSAVAHRYFTFNPDAFQNPALTPEPQTFECLDKLLLRVIQRMVNSAKAVNRWIVPLSGGYDSRIVVSYLHRLGIRNVLCFSYGRAGNDESAISKQVAEALGYEWHFVEYNQSAWTALMADPNTLTFLRYACSGTSMPVLQDYLALKSLLSTRVLSEGDIVVPGHGTLISIALTGLFRQCSGAIAVKPIGQTLKVAVDAVVSRHASFWWDDKGRVAVRKRILSLMNMHFADGCGATAAAMVELFEWQERQSKFIGNNVRVYERLGLKWRMPLWDQDLTEWWMSVPYEYRMNKFILREAFKTRLAVPEVRSIPIYGARTVTIDDATPTTKTAAWGCRLFCGATTILRGERWYRSLSRIYHHYYPPGTSKTPMAFEELFAEKAATVGELLGLSQDPQIVWPSSLRRHFAWREEWTVQRGGGESNALLAAYVLKQYLPAAHNCRPALDNTHRTTSSFRAKLRRLLVEFRGDTLTT